MSTLVTRAGKGSPLTHNEVDANFTNLNTDKIQSGNTVAALTITALTTPSVQAGSSAGLALKNSAGTTQISMGAGGGDNITVAAPIAITPANGLVNIAPTGTGSLTINPATAGTMNNMAIGGTTAAAATVTSLTIGTTQLGAGNSTIMKNRIINGAMVIDQRNAGASVTPSNGDYTLDRWRVGISQSSKFSVQQSTTAPIGFSNSFLATSTSAYTVGASEYFLIQQAIEGFNFADCGWGTANAKTVTLSFWVRSSLTGTFGGSLFNASLGRSYPYSYTISAANTWEQKSITIAGDTTGTWVGATNDVGVYVSFSLGSGSSVSGTAGSWSSTWYGSSTGATSVVGTSGATLYITGVQLEVGSSATGYEYRLYNQELSACQRYYQLGAGFTSGYAAGASTMGGIASLSTTMRAAPTATVTSAGAPPGANFSGSPSAGTTTTTYIPATWGTNGVAGNAYGVFNYTASAEL
jgi:hypothetical protein